MADIQHTMSLDDSRFEQGLKKAFGTAQQQSQKMETAFGRLSGSFESAMRFAVFKEAAKQAFTIGSDLVDGYAKRFSFARRELDGLGGALDQFRLSLGRDLFSLASGSGGGWLDEAIKTLGDYRERAVNALADLITGEPGGAKASTEELKLKEAQDIQDRLIEKIEAVRSRLRPQVFQARGQTGAAQIVSENDQHVRNLKEIGLLGGSPEATGLRMLEQNRHEAVLRSIQVKADKERRAAAEKTASEKHGLEIDRQRLEIQTMRLKGHQKEADLAETELQFSEKEREIQRSDNLTAGDKRAALLALSTAQGRLLGAMKSKGDRGTDGFSGSEVSDSRVRGLIFGPGNAGKDEVVKNTRVAATEAVKSGQRLDDIGQTLKSIERKTGIPAGVFG